MIFKIYCYSEVKNNNTESKITEETRLKLSIELGKKTIYVKKEKTIQKMHRKKAMFDDLVRIWIVPIITTTFGSVLSMLILKLLTF